MSHLINFFFCFYNLFVYTSFYAISTNLCWKEAVMRGPLNSGLILRSTFSLWPIRLVR